MRRRLIALGLCSLLLPVLSEQETHALELQAVQITRGGFGAVIKSLGNGRYVISDQTKIRIYNLRDGTTTPLIPRYLDTRWTDYYRLTGGDEYSFSSFNKQLASGISKALGKLYVDYSGNGRVAYLKAFDLESAGWKTSVHKDAFCRGTLYVANIDGSDEHLVCKDFADFTKLTWSPDGRWVASHDFIYDFKTRQSKRLSGEFVSYDISHDSKFLYGARRAGGDGEFATVDLVKVSLETGARQRVYTTPKNFIYAGGSMGLFGRALVRCSPGMVMLETQGKTIRLEGGRATMIAIDEDSDTERAQDLRTGEVGKIHLEHGTDPTTSRWKQTAYYIDRNGSHPLRIGNTEMSEASFDEESGRILAIGQDGNLYVFEEVDTECNIVD